MEKNKKLLIVNAHWSNRGDEAALRAIIDSLRKDQPTWSIEVMFKDANAVKEFPYNDISYFSSKFMPRSSSELFKAVYLKGDREKIKNPNLAEAVQKCLSADMLVYSPGGSVICDRFWWTKQLEYLLPFACSKIYGIPMVVAAPSIGPFDSWDKTRWKNIIRYSLLAAAQKICVRERTSEHYLKELFKDKEADLVKVTIDSAFLDDASDVNTTIGNDSELARFLSCYPRVIGITITDFDWHVQYAKDFELRERIKIVYADFIKEMAKQNIGILLIPQLFGNQNDADFLQTFRQENTLVFSEKYDTYSQQNIIAKLYAVIGMRYHSNIFAAKAGIPFIAVAYEEKMAGFMEDWHLQRYMLSLKALSLDNLLEKTELLVRDYEEYHLKLGDLRERWRALARQTVAEIESVMNNV